MPLTHRALGVTWVPACWPRGCRGALPFPLLGGLHLEPIRVSLS